MEKIATSYSTKEFYNSLDLLQKTSIEVGGADRFVRHTFDDLKDSEFFRENEYLLLRSRDEVLTDANKLRKVGYWMWKPFIILETMKVVDDGDIVLYTDAGVSIIDNLDPLYEIAKTAKDNRMLFEPSMIYGPHIHSMWTKRDCFILMGMDEPEYWQARMLHAAFSVWMKTQKNIEFLSEWQRYMTDPRVVTDEPNTCGKPNFPDFAEHRYDQAVLSLLSLKYGRELYREPTQFSNNEKEKFANSPYNQLFNHHSGNI